MDWGAISLIIFLAAIAFSFWKKTNLGILCLGLAVVVGHLAGMKDAEIYKGLNLNVFFNLVGVFALGAVLTSNGSLKPLSQKILSKVKASARLYPWVAFIFAAVFMAFSPGSGVSFTVVPFITLWLAARCFRQVSSQPSVRCQLSVLSCRCPAFRAVPFLKALAIRDLPGLCLRQSLFPASLVPYSYISSPAATRKATASCWAEQMLRKKNCLSSRNSRSFPLSACSSSSSFT